MRQTKKIKKIVFEEDENEDPYPNELPDDEEGELQDPENC